MSADKQKAKAGAGESTTPEQVNLSTTFIYAGVRYGPGVYTVTDVEGPHSQVNADELREIPRNAAESIQKKSARLAQRDRQIVKQALAASDPVLADDFPFKDELEANNVRSLNALYSVIGQGDKDSQKKNLIGLEGIGEKRAEAILAHLDKMGEQQATVNTSTEGGQKEGQE